MMEYKDFKIGTRVRRIHGNYKEMIEGCEDIIVSKEKENGLVLKKFGEGHDYNSFVILKAKTLKEFLKRTI